MRDLALQQQVDDYLRQVELGDIAMAPPGVLTVLVGDHIRITATVQYRGPAYNAVYRASIVQKIGTDYVVQAFSQVTIAFAQSAAWVTYTMVSPDIVVGGASLDTTRNADVQVEVGSLWARVEGVLSVIGASQFQALAITDYSKV